MGASVFIVIAALIGCAPPPVAIEETLAACGDEPLFPTYSSLTFFGDLPVIEVGCVERLHADIGLDIESFGLSEVRAVEGGESTYEEVIRGMFHLLRADVGSVNETLETPGLPQELYKNLVSVVDDYGLDDEDTANRLFYLMMADAVETTEYTDRREALSMWYRRGRLWVSELNTNVVPNIASTLVHEGYHQWDKHTRRCNSGNGWYGADKNPDGSYGVEMLYLYRSIRGSVAHQENTQEANDQRDLYLLLLSKGCSRIRDYEAFEPCEWGEQVSDEPFEYEDNCH